MDWVQIYTLVIISSAVISSAVISSAVVMLGVVAGKKAGKGFMTMLIGQLFSLPIYGRIFGWW